MVNNTDMPAFIFTDNTPEGKKRRALIDSLLPKKSIVDTFLQPRLMEAMEDVLIKALKQEIEIYKAYPKKGKYQLTTFDPRSPGNCFMGQGFRGNGLGLEGWYDGELQEYRRSIGTLSHKEWGDAVTLLEVWGGDHIKDYPEMVTGVMKYCWGERKTMPEVRFYVNPFYKNASSGKMVLTEDEKAQNKEQERIMKIAAYSEVKLWMKKHKTDRVMNFEPDDVTDEDIKNIPDDDEEEDES
jgi:hypothetical protein